VHAVGIDAGFENIGVACQARRGQKPAVGSAPQMDPQRRVPTVENQFASLLDSLGKNMLVS